MRNLTTASLELACWIARLGSFTAAAERLHTTQPAVSARVRELEEAVGHKLFVRQGRGVALSMEGREFVQKAELILQQLEDLSMSFSRANVAGVVRLGSSSICLDLLGALTATIAQSMPQVTFEVEINRAEPLLDALEARKLDLAMVSGPVDGHRFRRRSLGFDRMLWVATPPVLQTCLARPAAQRYRGLPVWCVHRHSFYWNRAIARLVAQGAELERVNAINHTQAIGRLVAAGSGIGLIAETLIRRELDEGSLVALPDVQLAEDIEFSIVCVSDSTSLVLTEVMNAAVAVTPFRHAVG